MPVVWLGTGTCESPCVVPGDRWRLFFKHGCCTHHGVSDSPFTFPAIAPLVDSHASEVFRWEEHWYISHCGRDGLSLAGLDFRDDAAHVLLLRGGREANR